jgi:hypothetical protein
MSTPAAPRPDTPPGPPTVNRKVPVRRQNADYHRCDYLSEQEMADVIVAAAARGRHDLRESTLILIAFCRGLRVSIVRARRRVKRDDSETCATSYIKLLKLNELQNFRGLGLEPRIARWWRGRHPHCW